MTARTSLTVAGWLFWVEAEAVTSGWMSVRPYQQPSNRSGVPDLILARDCLVLAVWGRPGDSSLTEAGGQWALALAGDKPTPREQVVGDGAIRAVLTHPTQDDRQLLRDLLR